MQNKPEHLYEYAVVRFVPQVEREEFINVGLIMMCKRKKWIKAIMCVNPDRLKAFSTKVPMDMLQAQLHSFCMLAAGDKSAGEMSYLPVEERFRWLTAVRSSCLQTSRPHPGLTDNLDATFDRLLAELVK